MCHCVCHFSYSQSFHIITEAFWFVCYEGMNNLLSYRNGFCVLLGIHCFSIFADLRTLFLRKYLQTFCMTNKHSHTCILSLLDTTTGVHACTHIHTRMHAHMHACTHTLTCSQSCTHINTDTDTQTQTHIHTLTHMHMRICTRACMKVEIV